MSFIAETFALVRPDTTNFARDLKRQLNDELLNFKVPPIKLQFSIDQASLREVKNRLQANPIKVPVQPILAAGAANKLRDQIIAQMGSRPVPVNVRVASVTGGGRAAAAATNTAAARTTAVQPAVVPAAKTAAVRPAVVPAVDKAAAAAAKELDALEDRLAATLGRVSAASELAAKSTTDLAKAQETQAVVGRAADQAIRDLGRAEEAGISSAIGLAGATRDQALEAKALADAQVKLIATKSRLGVDQSLSLTKQETAANAQLSEVLALQTQILATENVELAQRAELLVASASATAAGVVTAKEQAAATATQATAAAAAVEAEAALAAAKERQAPVIARQIALESELAAVQAASVLSAESGAAQVENLARTRAALGASTKLVADLEREGLVDAAALAAGHRQELEIEENLLATRVALAKGSADLAAADAAAAKPAGLLAKAKAELATIEKALIPLQEANERALLTEDAALQKNTAEVLANARAREISARASVASAPFRTRIAQIEESLALVATPVGTSQRELAASANSAAELAQRQQVKLIRDIQLGTLAATDADLARAQALGLETTRTEQLTAAEVTRLRNLEKSTVVQSQVARGAAATSASFLGLRGAVLSSSGGFLAATVAVTALAKVVGQASELQQSFNTFQAVTGATADQMLRVSAAAKDLGADLSLPATSANDAAEAMTELSKAGLSVEDSIDASRGVLQLSAAASLSAGEAAKLAATELNAFGLAGDQAERVTNLLAGASIQAQGEITDFAAAFQQASAQSKQAGLSIEQTTALLTQLARAGIRGSDAGTSLRVELLRLVPGTKPAQEAFEKLGIQIDRTMTIGAQLPSIIDQFSRSLAKLPTQDQTSVLRDIFGQDAGRAAIITLTDGAAAFAKVEAEVSKAGNASTLTEAKAKGLGGAVSGLGSTTENLSATIGKDLLPVLTALTHELTDIVAAADQVASAFNPVFDTLGKITGAFGGGDTVVQILLVVGAASALNAQLKKRAATSAANAIAAKEEAFAQLGVTVATDEAVLAQRRLAAAFAETASVAVSSGRLEVAAITATIAATNAEIAALAREETAQQRKGLRGAFSGPQGRSGAVGLAAGVAATTAGSFIPGTAGSIVTAAGAGALAGSFFPGPGTVIGASGAALIASMQAANQHAKEETTKAKAEFEKMTFIQQQEWLRGMGGDTANFVIKVFGLRPKANPFQGTFTFGPLLSPAAPTAATTVRDELNTALANADVSRRARQSQQASLAAGQFAFGGTELAAQREQQRTSAFSPGQISPAFGGIQAALSQRDADNAKTIAELQKAVVDARGNSRALQTAQRALARERDRQIKQIIPSILTAIEPATASQTGSRATLGPTARIALELSIAAVNKDEEATVALLGERLTNQRLHVQALEAKVTLFKLSVADYNAAIKEITATNDKIAETQAAIATELQNSATRFDPALAAAELAATNAELTASAADDIAAAKAKAAASAKRADEVANAEKEGITNTPETIAAAKQQAASDRVAVKTAQDQARDEAKRRAEEAARDAKKRADDAAKAAQEALQLQADELKAAAVAAGSRGRAEAKLIAFLKHQVSIAKQHTRERLEAENALADEIDNQKAVLAASTKLSTELANARLDTAASAAALTKTTTDDIAVDRLRIRAIDRQIKAAQDLRSKAKKGTDEWTQLGIEIEGLKQRKNGVLGDIQSLQGGPKGFTLTELFGAAAAQFQTFGSNIAGRSGVLSGQDERAAFSKEILDSRGVNGNPLATAHLTEAQKQTILLSQILDRLRINPAMQQDPSVADGIIAKKFPNASPAWRRAIFAQQSGYYT